MRDVDFSKWLKKEKEYSVKSTSDALSRCRRIERTFAVSLDKTLSSESGLERRRERVSNEAERLVGKDKNKLYTARGAHRLALKRYFEFLRA